MFSLSLFHCLPEFSHIHIDMATVKFQPYSTFYVAGATNSGKTYWVHRFLLNCEDMFTDDPPSKILYSYSIYQSVFLSMEKELSNITFINRLPTIDDITEFASDGKHGIIVIDDQMTEATRSSVVEDLFTKGSHHLKISSIFITQNMFNNSPKNRTIALNTQYMIITKNPRACSQLNTLAQQLFGKGKSNILCEAYNDIMKKPYGYLVIDLHPSSNTDYMLRTEIFPKENLIVYVIP